MADFAHVQTNGRVETFGRGRVFAKRTQSDRDQPASHERRRVCVLSEYSTRLVELWGIRQPCSGPTCDHKHLTREAVNALVGDGILRFVKGSGRNVAGYTYGREWRGVPSGGPMGPKVMQLV